MGAKAWTTTELRTLRQMAARGCSVDEVARALRRSRVSVRSQATHHGVHFHHAITNTSSRVSLPPDLQLRLKLAAEAQGGVSPSALIPVLLTLLPILFPITALENISYTGNSGNNPYFIGLTFVTGTQSNRLHRLQNASNPSAIYHRF